MGTPYADRTLDRMMVERIEKRIRLNDIYEICGVDFVIAGGAMLAQEPNDYDIYAANANAPFDFNEICARAEMSSYEKIGHTLNALTFRDKEKRVIQFCRYVKDDPDDLIRSFDFAHCQAGVYMHRSGMNTCVGFCCTSEFLRAMALQRTFFVGTEYPMSSLMRLVKYVRRGLYGDGRGYMPDLVKIVTRMVERGFYDYHDFENQFDAIDLSYKGEEIKAFWNEAQKCLMKTNPMLSSAVGTDCPF